MASFGLIIFGPLNFQIDDITFEYSQQDIDLYESFVTRSIEAIGSDYVWYNSTRKELNEKITKLSDFTDILFIAHTYKVSLIIGCDVELLFYDETLLQTVQSKNVRIFIYTCFNDLTTPLPSSLTQLSCISEICNRVNISLDLSEMNRIDEMIVNVSVLSLIESFTAASVGSMYFEDSGITLRAGKNSSLLRSCFISNLIIYTLYYIILVHYVCSTERDD